MTGVGQYRAIFHGGQVVTVHDASITRHGNEQVAHYGFACNQKVCCPYDTVQRALAGSKPVVEQVLGS